MARSGQLSMLSGQLKNSVTNLEWHGPQVEQDPMAKRKINCHRTLQAAPGDPQCAVHPAARSRLSGPVVKPRPRWSSPIRSLRASISAAISVSQARRSGSAMAGTWSRRRAIRDKRATDHGTAHACAGARERRTAHGRYAGRAGARRRPVSYLALAMSAAGIGGCRTRSTVRHMSRRPASPHKPAP